ncbi:DUF1877 family protein [Pacificoceanicola onchidii]|uniref:DUF1877 family protein n=1 Tax=Pacificoceanicola onchidii TaxID=2562685 RepID=UPI0010A3ECF6|nr:DUF1877 family protein [Pacificoceanicola onchidii]
MSMSLTLRRFALDDAPQEPGDEAAEFALGLKGIKLLDGPECLHFFDPWHVVHFLSSGTEWDTALPAGFLLGGSAWHEIHPEEEPPRILSPKEVKAAHAHLISLPHDLLDSRLSAMKAPGCEIYHAAQSDAEDGSVRAAFGQIRDFLGAAAEADQAVLTTMA